MLYVHTQSNASTSGLVVKSNVAIVGPWVRFPASASIAFGFFRNR